MIWTSWTKSLLTLRTGYCDATEILSWTVREKLELLKEEKPPLLFSSA